MDELEEILYEYRCGLRGLPTYEELNNFVNYHKSDMERVYESGYNKGYARSKYDD